MQDSPNEVTLETETWEDEGGSLGSIPRDPNERHDAPGRELPSGYEAQPFWGFHDQTGRFSYQFHHVYGPPSRRDRRGPTRLLDQQLSYWAVTWSTRVRTADQRLAGRSMSYAQARKLRGPGLTFERFSTMRYQLPELLQVGEVSLELLPTTT